MDIDIVLKKGTTYILLLILLFVPSFLFVLICQKLFFGRIHYLFSIVISSVLFLVSILFHRIKPGTEKTVEQLLFKDKYDYRETLADFSKAMVSILDLNSLSKRIIDTITQTMGVEKASIFLFIEEKGGFEILYSKNVKIDSGGLLLSKNDPLPHYLQNMGEIIIREELAKGVNISELEEVVNQMATLEAQVSIPLIFKEQLIGIINLGYKFNKEIYSYEDIELLTTLANQAAIAIENAKLYEDLKKSKSYIRRADRLASLGTLTAGLAHEIRNPLVAIKTFTQLLPERLEDEEFRDRFLRIASGEVDRIAMLINELLDFARPSDPKFEPEDVNNILDGMILLISTEAKKKNIKITKNFDPNLPPINIDREQMKQVFLNILINAIEATPDNGEVTVKSRSFTKPNGERYIQIEFKDTGHGIPKEYLEEIFNPFFTTKTTGSGLGLSISNQIVQEHKGYIHVESQINKGSSFFVNLPLNQEHPKRRKTDFEDNSVTKDFDFFERR
ncbi:MAG: ATP-binding protein [Candidatus Aenigmatarchaeota archaeon]